MIRKTFRMMLSILFSIVILTACAKPKNTVMPLTSTLVPSPTESSIAEMPVSKHPPVACNGTTEIISVSSDGTLGNGTSEYPSITTDGRYVAFQSTASNLIDGDTNGYMDIFVHDRLSGKTTRVSVAGDGTQGNSNSYLPSISADGRYVVFESDATNLVNEDTNGSRDFFVHDRVTDKTTRVSVSSDGTEGNSVSDGFPNGFDNRPLISTDRRDVALISDATNLVDGDTNGENDVFVHDRVSGETQLVSVASDGTQGDSCSESPSISADGRYVVFESWASNLVEGDTDTYLDVFLHDRVTREIILVSVASDGTYAKSLISDSHLSADGHFLAFWSWDIDLVPGARWPDVFLHNRITGETIRVTAAIDELTGNHRDFDPSISADGRYVAFESERWGGFGTITGLYVFDQEAGETQSVLVVNSGSIDLPNFEQSSLSADGRYVVFASALTNLVDGDTNGNKDIFLYDLGTGK